VLKSGNREEQEKTAIQENAVTQEQKIETQPFKKPSRVLLPENMKVTSIKDTLEKNTQTSANQNNIDTDKQPLIQNQGNDQTQIENETVTVSGNELEVSEQEQEQETVFVSLQECWQEAIMEVATPSTIGLLSKQEPVETENHVIEIEVPNELAKQEIKEILPDLIQNISQKTGVSYTIEFKVQKIIQGKTVDTNNPDEKFKLLCQENPKLIDFKQQLNLTISY
jgi:hypothetical protein